MKKVHALLTEVAKRAEHLTEEQLDDEAYFSTIVRSALDTILGEEIASEVVSVAFVPLTEDAETVEVVVDGSDRAIAALDEDVADAVV